MNTLKNFFIVSVCFLLCVICFGNAHAGIGVEIDNAVVGQGKRDLPQAAPVGTEITSRMTGAPLGPDFWSHGQPLTRLGAHFYGPLLNPPRVNNGFPSTPPELFQAQTFAGHTLLPSSPILLPTSVTYLAPPDVSPAGECFPGPLSWRSVLTPAGNGGWYRWRIVCFFN